MREKKIVLASIAAQEIAATQQILPESNYDFYQPKTKKQDDYRTVHVDQVYKHMISQGEIKFEENSGDNPALEVYCKTADSESICTLLAK